MKNVWRGEREVEGIGKKTWGELVQILGRVCKNAWRVSKRSGGHR